MAETGSKKSKSSKPKGNGNTMHTFEGPTDHPSLHKTLDEALSNGEFSDITLVAKDTKFKTHRVILKSQCSKLLDKLNGSPGEVQLKADPNMLKHVLKYVYTNNTVVPRKDLMAVAKASEILGVKELETECIRDHLNALDMKPEICLEIWLQAIEISDEDIIGRAMQVALNSLGTVQKCAAFRSLNYDFLKEYITHSDLKVRAADEQIGAALTWVKADSEKRSEQLPSLLNVLPIGKVRSWFIDHLLSDPLIMANTQAADILIKGMQQE